MQALHIPAAEVDCHASPSILCPCSASSEPCMLSTGWCMANKILQSSIGLVKLLQLTRLGSKQPKVQECCNLQLQVACREVALSSGGTCMSWWVMCMKPCSPMCTKLLHAVAINPPDLLPANPALQDYPFADLELCWPLSRQHAAQYRIAGYTQQKAAHSAGQAGSDPPVPSNIIL